MAPLPIDPLIPRIQEHLRRSRCLVVAAPPGSGKTTRVPPALLQVLSGEVWVLEPRRLAARLAARRVAWERGERAGQTVGYQVRFEEVAGPHTRLRFMTEGVLTRRMLSDPQLPGVSAVVLDEFHERHLEGDLALALLRRLQHTSRPGLRLVAMSATLDAEALVRYLGDCPVARAQGRLFDLAITHLPYSGKPLEEQIADALATLLREGIAGDILVFLPGAAEIRRAARACAGLAARANLLPLPLHGELSPEEQDRAVAPADRPKLILSTNVAESSVTIDGVRAVIDSGLARVATDSPWTGLPMLRVARISKASAAQRAGRAGRTGPGRVLRLYSAEDFARRPGHDPPEILRRELSPTLLGVKAMGVESLDWLDAPPQPALAAAEELLRRLGALDSEGKLTATGREMTGLPLHPRLARLVLEARRRGAGEPGCGVAALLSSPPAGDRLDLSVPAGAPQPAGAAKAGPAPREGRASKHSAPSDLLVLLESEWPPSAQRAFEQIRSQAERLGGKQHASAGTRRRAARGARPGPITGEDEQALLIAILAAFPDRVARRRQRSGAAAGAEADLALAAGGSARLAASSVVQSELLVAVDIEERPDRGQPLVRLASGIEPEWLVDLLPERLAEKRVVEWNRAAERVEAVSALLYDGLVIEESRSSAVEDEGAPRLLVEKAWEAGVARFADADEVAAFLARAAFAAEHAGRHPPGEQDVRATLESLCAGLRSFAELEAAARRGGLLRALQRRLPDSGRWIEPMAPQRVRLPGGRQVRVHYSPHQPPWIASRLQDFFGMRETPRIGGGRVPLVVHLLAPNQLPVQVTTDLAGFWERHYPRVRRELRRRYPRHRWPEDPVAVS